MKKRYGCLALAAFMLVSSGMTARAEHRPGKDGWKVEYTGKALESNFTSKAFADEVSGLQPGDSVEIRVAVENGSKKSADWYMNNEVRQSLEDSSPAKGGAYTYELVWHGPKGENVLYSSESVGGETITAAGEGLHEATDNLENFFYLDHLSGGEKGYITLRVALNGETQGNTYQNTLARLQMNFAVENAEGENTPNVRRSVTYSLGSVQTGDPGGMMLWAVAMLVSGLAFMVCAMVFLRRRRGGEDDE